jgi:hypothetical protein
MILGERTALRDQASQLPNLSPQRTSGTMPGA